MHESSVLLSLSHPPALPTRLQYYCTTIGQYTTPPPTYRLYATDHTILVITISCKCQPSCEGGRLCRRRCAAGGCVPALSWCGVWGRRLSGVNISASSYWGRLPHVPTVVLCGKAVEAGLNGAAAGERPLRRAAAGSTGEPAGGATGGTAETAARGRRPGGDM